MIETKEKEIDGHVFSVTQFNGREGFRIKTKLIKLLAPSLAELAGGIKNFKPGKLLDAEIKGQFVGNAVSRLAEALDENEFLLFVMRIFQTTRYDGKQISDGLFDFEFAGNFEIVYKAISFVLEVNYGNFFGLGGIGNLMEKANKTTQ